MCCGGPGGADSGGTGWGAVLTGPDRLLSLHEWCRSEVLEEPRLPAAIKRGGPHAWRDAWWRRRCGGSAGSSAAERDRS